MTKGEGVKRKAHNRPEINKVIFHYTVLVRAYNLAEIKEYSGTSEHPVKKASRDVKGRYPIYSAFIPTCNILICPGSRAVELRVKVLLSKYRRFTSNRL
jgi:hypothetical protein